MYGQRLALQYKAFQLERLLWKVCDELTRSLRLEMEFLTCSFLRPASLELRSQWVGEGSIPALSEQVLEP